MRSPCSLLVALGLALVTLLVAVDGYAGEPPSCAFDAPAPAARHVDGKTLETELRAGKPTTVSLRNVVVSGDLVLDELALSGALAIEDAVIDGKLSLRDVRARAVSVRRTRVRGELVLDGVQTDRDLAIDESALCGGAKAARLAIGTDFTVGSSRVCMDGSPPPPKERTLEPTVPTFSISRGHVGGDLRFDAVRETCPLSIRSFRAGARIVLKGVTIPPMPDVPVLEVLGVESQSGVFFWGAHVGDARVAVVKGGFSAIEKTQFEGEALLSGIESGPLIFAGCETKGGLWILDSTPSSVKIADIVTRGNVTIAGVRTTGMFNVVKLEAHGPWQFFGVSSGAIFELASSEFRCEKDCTCDPDSASCARNQLVSIEARGGIQFSRTKFGRPTLVGNLNDASMLGCDHCVFAAPFEVYSAHFSGLIELGNAEIRAPFTLIDVKTSQLGVEKPIWGVPREQVHFRGVDFRRLDLGQDDPSFERVFELLDHIDYSRDLYESAAQHVQHEGRADIARNLRLASAKRELGEGTKAAGGTLRYVWRAFLYVTIGGGVAPERAFVVLFGLLLFGTWLYRDKSLMLWRGRAAEPHYSAFWYTVDLLLPVMKLDDARDWSPLPEHRGRIYVGRVMRVVGFLMVPLLLAAATGLVR